MVRLVFDSPPPFLHMLSILLLTLIHPLKSMNTPLWALFHLLPIFNADHNVLLLLDLLRQPVHLYCKQTPDDPTTHLTTVMLSLHVLCRPYILHHTSSSCSTAVPLLVPSHLLSLDSQRHGAGSYDLLCPPTSTFSKQLFHL